MLWMLNMGITGGTCSGLMVGRTGGTSDTPPYNKMCSQEQDYMAHTSNNHDCQLIPHSPVQEGPTQRQALRDPQNERGARRIQVSQWCSKWRANIRNSINTQKTPHLLPGSMQDLWGKTN